MEETKEEKKKPKRKVSIFTIFLWLLLVIVMSIVVITGIYKQNAYEYEIDENLTGVKVTFNEETSLNLEEFLDTNYLEIYYEKDGTMYCLNRYYNDELAGETIIIPSTDFYIYTYVVKEEKVVEVETIYSDNVYGFKIDKVVGYTGEITEFGEEKTMPSTTPSVSYGYIYPESRHYSTYVGRNTWEYHYINDHQNTVTVKIKPEFFGGEGIPLDQIYQNNQVYLEEPSILGIPRDRIKITGKYDGVDQEGNVLFVFENVPSGNYRFNREVVYLEDYYQVIKDNEGEVVDYDGNDDEDYFIGELEKRTNTDPINLFVVDNTEINYTDEFYLLSTIEFRVKAESSALIPDEKIKELAQATYYLVEYGEGYREIFLEYTGYEDGYYIYRFPDNLKALPSIALEDGYNVFIMRSVIDERVANGYNTFSAFEENGKPKYYQEIQMGSNVFYLTNNYTYIDTYIKNEAKWLDQEDGIIESKISYTSTSKALPLQRTSIGYGDFNGIQLFTYTLNEGFSLSSEYIGDENWQIWDEISGEMYSLEEYLGFDLEIPVEIGNDIVGKLESIIKELEEEFGNISDDEMDQEEINKIMMELIKRILNVLAGDHYYYVKSSNTIYWLKICDIPKNEEKSFYLTYQNVDNLSEEVELYPGDIKADIVSIFWDMGSLASLDFLEFFNSTSTYSTELFVAREDPMIFDSYRISSPCLLFSSEDIQTISVSLKVNGIPKENNYYVGVFKDKTSTQAEEVKEIVLKNLSGNVVFDMKEEQDTYYIYMTDCNGNKIEDEQFQFDTHEVDMNHLKLGNTFEVVSNPNIVSSVRSGMIGASGGIAEKGETVGLGEDSYVNNQMNQKNIYQGVVNIVKNYETERFDLSIQIDWEDHNNEKNTRPDEVELIIYGNGIEMERITITAKDDWKYIIKDLAKNDEEGNPIQYTIKEETVNGYETRVEENQNYIRIINTLKESADTSDIAVWKYGVIGMSSILVIGIIVFIVIRKKNKKQED